MKKYMHKVLVERPRIGSWMPNYEIHSLRLIKPTEDDLAPMRLSMRPKHSFGYGGWYFRKELNENLKPLLRYLQSNVGLLWDDVYRAIRIANPLGNAITEHIYVHLFEYVQVHPIFINGHPHNPSLRDSLIPCQYFYVDQEGLLQKSSPKIEPYSRPQELVHNGKTYIRKELSVDPKTKVHVLFREEDQVWFWETPFRTISKKDKKKLKIAS